MHIMQLNLAYGNPMLTLGGHFILQGKVATLISSGGLALYC